MKLSSEDLKIRCLTNTILANQSSLNRYLVTQLLSLLLDNQSSHQNQRSSSNQSVSINAVDNTVPSDYDTVSIAGDGNCFLNSYSALLMHHGQAVEAQRGAIMALLSDNTGTESIGSEITEANLFNRDLSHENQKQITGILKQKFASYVEVTLNSLKGSTEALQYNRYCSIIQELYLTYYPHHKGNLDIDSVDVAVRKRYEKEIQGDGIWLGIESTGLMSQFLAENGIVFEDATSDNQRGVNGLFLSGVNLHTGQVINQGSQSKKKNTVSITHMVRIGA